MRGRKGGRREEEEGGGRGIPEKLTEEGGFIFGILVRS
jgi:hypothetical protein